MLFSVSDIEGCMN